MSRSKTFGVRNRQGSFWTPKSSWAPCVFCAKRMTKKEAHALAHSPGGVTNGWVVVRFVRRRP